MHKDIRRLIEKQYDNNGVPAILDADRGVLWGVPAQNTAERFIKCFCDAYEIPSSLRPDLLDARDFVTEVSIATRRLHVIVTRLFRDGTEVVYDSLPTVTTVFAVKSITDDFLIELSNGQLCHPLWIKKAP